MNNTYLNLIALAGANAITHIGLVDEEDNEISGGTPAYERKAVTWDDTDGLIRPDSNLVFDIPADTEVAGWQGYSASTGGTAYGPVDLGEDGAVFSIQGTYTLESASTGINHQVST